MNSLPHRRVCAALAIAAYLLIALFTMRNVLRDPSNLLPYPKAIGHEIQMVLLDHFDQAMVIATMVRNAQLITTRPWDLTADVGQCYPMPGAYTLGEHMFGFGLLAAVPYALSADPILSFNLAVIFTLWIPGITMYFLSLRFTRSPAAAFVAGLAFVLVPERLIDPSHPYVHGDLWAPAVLLFLHRLFVHARWRDALALALFANLEIAESLYPLLSTFLLAATYSIYLAFRHSGNLPRVLPRLALSTGLCALGAWFVLAPYLETSATWDLLSGRSSVMVGAAEFLPGGQQFPGFLILTMMAIALLDRTRGARLVHGEDPRLVILTAGLLLLWCSLGPTPIPLLGVTLESPLIALRGILPGVEAVRALAAIGIGAGVASSFLVGYAVLALSEGLRPRPTAPVVCAAGIALLLLALRFVPALADGAFDRTFQFTTFEARPDQEEIDLLRAVGRGPLLDYPLGATDGRNKRLDIANALLLASYDPRPLAACYNSFHGPPNTQMIALTSELPSVDSIDAIAALGFDTVLLHRKRAGAKRTLAFESAVANDPEVAAKLEPLGKTSLLRAYRIHPGKTVHEDFALLGPAIDETAIEGLSPRTWIDFAVANLGTDTFRHPSPLEPSDLLIRWINEDGNVTREDPHRALLPIALGATAQMEFRIRALTPEEPGSYRVTLARAETPDRILASRRVDLPRLEDVMSPNELAFHVHHQFLKYQVTPLGYEVAFPPEDEIEVLLAPGVRDAADLRQRGNLAAHWANVAGHRETKTIAADVRPSDLAGYVRLRLEIPDEIGLHGLLLTTADDPRTLVGGRLVFPDVATVQALEKEARGGEKNDPTN